METNKDIICWWYGGITSAVACKLAIDMYSLDRCRVIMIDTCNEHEDTYRFKKDCENWYGCKIETITAIGNKYSSIQDVWESHLSLNTATGAICSSRLKRAVREEWQKSNSFTHQIFGFEFNPKEFNRALSLKMNHVAAKPIFPLLMLGLDKDECLKIVANAGIEVPVMYKMGFRNNNCFNTGCVQGGIGYWQKIRREFPDKFEAMAKREHYLSKLKGSPITMLKDQSNEAKLKTKTNKYANLVFLQKNPDYPELKCLDDMPSCKVEPLFECNGFCGVNDLNERNETEKEINYATK